VSKEAPVQKSSIALFDTIELRLVTDGQTQGQSIASRGKNNTGLLTVDALLRLTSNGSQSRQKVSDGLKTNQRDAIDNGVLRQRAIVSLLLAVGGVA